MKVVVKQSQKNLYEASILNDDLVSGGELFLGRESDCHIQLDSYQISRYHASILIEDNKLLVRAISEYGGVKLNGNEVKEGLINENDKIEIGDFEILISQLPVVSKLKDSTENAEVYEEDTLLFPQKSDDSSLDNIDEVIETDDLFNDKAEIENADLIKNNEDDPNSLDDGDSFLSDNLEGDEGILSSEENSDELLENVDSNSDNIDDLNQSEEKEDNMFESDKTENFDQEEFQETEEGFSEGSDFENDGFGGDDGFPDDDFADNGDAGEATQVMQTFAKYSLKLFGEYAPFDRFIVEEKEVFIGRDPEKCEIVLDDPEVSKVHCVIKKTLVSCSIEDLDSANGILYNGERINKASLTNGDEFIIGDTTFSVEIVSDLIESEKGMLMPVEEGQQIEIEEVVEEEVDYDGFENGDDFSTEATEVEEKSFIKKIMKDPKKKRIAMVVIVLGLVMWMLSDDTTAPTETAAEIESQAKKNKLQKEKDALKTKYSPEQLEQLEQNYALALAKYQKNQFYEAKEYIDIVMSLNPTYKDSQSLSKVIQESLDGLIKLKAQEQEEKERRKRQIEIAGLLVKARKAVKDRNEKLARNYFNMIFDLDPENIDVPSLKLEIEAYIEEEKRKKHEAALVKAARQNKLDKLSPGKTLYLKRDWYKAIDRLEKFIKISDMDEDLIKEATSMLSDSQKKLLMIVNPLISKARSFREGQDLKQAYETFGEVLKYDPINEEALNARDGIFATLTNRSKRVYRDALVAESLSLFGKAKEKFQEVQQISPINSEYYNKATSKLKDYLE